MNRFLFALLLALLLPTAAVAQITSSPQTVNGPLVVQGNAYVNGGGLCVNPLGSTGGNAGGICTNALNSQITSGGNLGFPIAGTLGLTLGTTGGATLGSPTGGMPSVGVLNAQGLEINGQSFSTIPGSSLITPAGGSVASTLGALLGRVINVLDYGAKCDGSTDDTAAFTAAIDRASTNGGAVVLPPGNCIISSTLTIQSSNVLIVGAGPRTSEITCKTESGDCIDVRGISTSSQVYGDFIRDVHIIGSSLSGGNLVSFRFAAQGGMNYVILDQGYDGFTASGINDIVLANVYVDENAGTGQYGIQWNSAVAGERSDVLTLQHVTVNMTNGTSDCIIWNGNTDTLRMFGVNALNCYNGLDIEDSDGATDFPDFLQADDFEVDIAKEYAIYVNNYAQQLYVVNSQLTTNLTQAAVSLSGNTDTAVFTADRIEGLYPVYINSGAKHIVLGANVYNSSSHDVFDGSGTAVIDKAVGADGEPVPATVGAVPTISSCGTGASATGSSISGIINTGSGTVTSCTVNFNPQWDRTPYCTVTSSNTGFTPAINTVSATGFGILFSTSIPSTPVYYNCQ